MDQLAIVAANYAYRVQFQDYFNRCLNENLEYYQQFTNDSNTFLRLVTAHAQGQQLPEGWGPYYTYYALVDNEIVGAIRVRMGNTELLEFDIGHIGYEVAPQYQGRGIARAMLSYVLTHVVKVSAIAICAQDNIASQKVIQACGGVFIDSREDDEEVRLRYRLQPLAA